MRNVKNADGSRNAPQLTGKASRAVGKAVKNADAGKSVLMLAARRKAAQG